MLVRLLEKAGGTTAPGVPPISEERDQAGGAPPREPLDDRALRGEGWSRRARRARKGKSTDLQKESAHEIIHGASLTKAKANAPVALRSLSALSQ